MTERFLRLKDVKVATGLGGSTIYRLIRDDLFPAPVKLGPKISAWAASEIARWQQRAINKRDKRGRVA